MKGLFVIIFLLLSTLVYGVFLNQYDLQVVRQPLKPLSSPLFYDYKGALNIHTEEGLGRDSPQKIMEAARRVGLDFVIFSDLNVIGPHSRMDGYYGRTLSIEGAMYSYVDSRLLYISNESLPEFSSLSNAQVYLADLISQPAEAHKDTVIVLVHPLKKGYEWKGTLPEGLNGLEVLNLKSLWQQSWGRSKISFLASFLIYPFNSPLALLRFYNEPSGELELWTQHNGDRKLMGFLGQQATARTQGLFGSDLRFPSYDLSFSIASTHILLRSELTGQYAKDKTKIIEALRSGSFYIAFDLLGNPLGFSSYAKMGDTLYLPGSDIPLGKNLNLNIDLPGTPNCPFEIALYKDGNKLQSVQNETHLEIPIETKGAYRIQVRVRPSTPLPEKSRWHTWIYTNHFYVH